MKDLIKSALKKYNEQLTSEKNKTFLCRLTIIIAIIILFILIVM